MKKLLLSFAHPDDESFATGITAAKYARAGWHVRLICATFGDAGRSGPYQGINGQALGAIRREEAEKAAAILGIKKIEFLGYPDGGLDGIETGELEDILHKKMLEYAPCAVITFGTDGVSNHPDHIKMCFATTFAFQKYAKDLNDTAVTVDRVSVHDPTVKKRHFMSQHKFALKQAAFIDAVDARITPRLYYAVVPRSLVGHLQEKKLMPHESFGKPMLGTDDEKITTVIEGKQVVSKKAKALEAHVTQESPFKAYLAGEGRGLAAKEYFILRMIGETEFFMGKNDRISDRL